jgi:hypothetical protein
VAGAATCVCDMMSTGNKGNWFWKMGAKGDQSCRSACVMWPISAPMSVAGRPHGDPNGADPLLNCRRVRMTYIQRVPHSLGTSALRLRIETAPQPERCSLTHLERQHGGC